MREPFRAVIIGAGGVGSWLAHGLARQMEYVAPGSGIIIVDGDTFEPKNKERQNFRGMGNKAEVLAAELAPEFPKTTILPVGKWVVESSADAEAEDETDEESEEEVSAGKISAKDLLCEGDVIYAVVDNDAARKTLVQAASQLDNVDLFTAGNDEMYYGSVYHYRRRDGKDITVNPLENHPEYENPADRNPGDMSCQERAEIEGGTQLVATNMAVASYLLARTDKMILKGEDFGEEEVEIFFDLGVGKAQGYNRAAVQQEETTNTMVYQGV